MGQIPPVTLDSMRRGILLILEVIEELIKLFVQSGHLPFFGIHRPSFCFFVSTIFVTAVEGGVSFHGAFSQYKIPAADRTGFGHWFIPGGELALGKIAAPVEIFSSFGLFFLLI